MVTRLTCSEAHRGGLEWRRLGNRYGAGQHGKDATVQGGGDFTGGGDGEMGGDLI